MSGMNPGFAAYLAARKSKGAATSDKVVAPSVTGSMDGMMPMMAKQPKGTPKGKRHAKVKRMLKKG